MKQRVGFERWSSRSISLGRRGADPRNRRDAQKGVAAGVRLNIPLRVNKKGQVDINLPKTGPLKSVKGQLSLVPAPSVTTVDATVATTTQVAEQLNAVIAALTAAGLMEKT